MSDGLRKQDISYFPLNHLRPARENGLLYDGFNPQVDDDDAKLYWSIKVEGIREPLHISADGYILSGHRRYAAACWLGLTVVPCIVDDGVVFNDLLPYQKKGVDMKKPDAEREIRSLITKWRQQEPQRDLSNDELHCSDFIAWLRNNSPGHLDFRSTMSVTYMIEMWFDQELGQSWRN